MTEVVAGHGVGAKTATFVVDLDGVLYLDGEAIPGAGAALTTLEARGHRLVFVTNNSAKAPATVVSQIADRTGYKPRLDSVVTSGMATGAFLEGKAKRAFVVGASGLVETLGVYGVAAVTDWRDADAVVVGLDVAFNYRRLADASAALRNGALFVATNLDSTFPTPAGLAPGGGSLATAISVASGMEPIVCGKPNEPIRAMVREVAGAGPVWVIGDRPDTDLAMAKVEGWGSILVLSGVVDDPSEVPESLAPDVVLETIAELPQTPL